MQDREHQRLDDTNLYPTAQKTVTTGKNVNGAITPTFQLQLDGNTHKHTHTRVKVSEKRLQRDGGEPTVTAPIRGSLRNGKNNINNDHLTAAKNSKTHSSSKDPEC